MFRIQILIIAAGKGKRMKSDLPKALLPLKGKPMILHLMDSVQKSGVCDTPAIVIGHKAEMIQQTLGPQYIYVHQNQQLGTGHAVLCAKKQLQGKSEHVLVLYADQPFIRPETIIKMVHTHEAHGDVVTLASMTVPDFEDWRNAFFQFGRIVRDKDGKVKKIVEFKDATEKQKKIKELNPTYFCFRADWLWENIEKLENHNAQKEYYLTDLISLALQQGRKISTVEVVAQEALGANTEAELKILEKSVY